MKRNITLLISIIALFSCFYFFKLEIEKEGLLKGNKIANNLYAYNLKADDKDWNGYYVKENEIYYLISNKDSYELYKRDIYKKESNKIKEFKNSSNCNLVNDYISCNNDNKITIYDYEYKRLYETEIGASEDYPKIIKYKDTYLKYLDSTLYIKQKDKESAFRVLPEELKETFVEDYYIGKNNTYLLLYNLNNSIHYIYDINKNEYKEIKSKNSYKYSNGFYFYDKDKYTIINLKDKKEESYKNLLETEYYYTSFLNKKELYYFNIIDDEINIFDLEKGILKKIKIDITKDNNISNLELIDNYLYIEIQDNDGYIYILNLENVNYEEINIAEKLKKEDENLVNVIEEIKSNNNLTIHIKEETNIKFPDFSAEVITNNTKISEALVKVKSILDKYNKDFFDSFYFEKYEGLHIYLTSKLTPSDLENQISNPAAYSLINNYKFMIVIDVNQPNIEELLCHELIHNLEFVLTRKSITPFSEWNKFNPEDFNYNNSYTKTYIYNYTITEEDKDKVYFLDKYSHTYDSEDRARVFESICSCTENSVVKNYPNIYKKAEYLETEIYKYYPSLKDTTLFNSLK